MIKNKKYRIALAVAALLIVGALGFFLATAFNNYRALPTPIAKPVAEATAERVLGTNFIQCGFQALSPLLQKTAGGTAEPAAKGPLVDYMNGIMAQLALRVSYQPLNPEARPSAFANGTVDADCFATLNSPAMRRAYWASAPLFYVPYYFYMADRATTKQRLESADAIYAAAQASVAEQVRAAGAPLAGGNVRWFSPYYQHDALQAVADGGADLTVANPYEVASFNAAQTKEGARPLQKMQDTPVYWQSYHIILPRGPSPLPEMLNDAIRAYQAQMQISGSDAARIKAALDSAALMSTQAPLWQAPLLSAK